MPLISTAIFGVIVTLSGSANPGAYYKSEEHAVCTEKFFSRIGKQESFSTFRIFFTSIPDSGHLTLLFIQSEHRKGHVLFDWLRNHRGFAV
jgi:hypothetical protein